MATPIQIKLIHTLKGALSLDEDTYRSILADNKVKSSKDLTPLKAARLIRDLEDKAIAAGVWQTKAKKPGKAWQRPKNMETGTRAEQLKKIEALLTIGGLPWSYADAIAKQMRLADKIQWVESADLYRIITALRKRAQKEGWDLSGENPHPIPLP
jgi:phage gp16-like protein